MQRFLRCLITACLFCVLSNLTNPRENRTVITTPATATLKQQWDETFPEHGPTGFMLFEKDGELWLVCHGSKDGKLHIGGEAIDRRDIDMVLEAYGYGSIVGKYRTIHVHACFNGRWPSVTLTHSGRRVVPSQRDHTGVVRSQILDEQLILLK